MRGRSFVVGLMASLAWTGCALFTSLDGFSEGEPAVEDGGAGADAAILEGGDGQALDGGGEAAVDAGPFCSTVQGSPVLCLDFDDEVVPPNVSESGGGSVSVDRGASRSPPASLRLSSPPSNGTIRASVARAIGGVTSEVVVELDLLVEALGQGDELDVIILRSGESEVGFELTPSGAFRFDEDIPIDGGLDNRFGPTSAVVRTGWMHVKWTSRVTGSKATNELEVDGKSAGTYESQGGPFSQSTSLQLGDHYTTGVTQEWRIRLDNVVVYTR